MSKIECVKKLEYAFSIGADVSAACYYADISRQTYYNYIEEDPVLKERFDRLREKPALAAYETVFSNLNKEETAKWYLERKKKSEFSTKTEVDNNLTLKSVLTEEEKDKADKAISSYINDNPGNSTIKQ